jgi:hypothetical protein
MPFKSGILDREVVLVDEQHRWSFNPLGTAIGREASRFSL